MCRIILVLLAVVALSGCAAQRAAFDDGKCRSYGAAPGSSAYINCRTQLDTTRTIARQL